jgi:tight adherence protein C
MLEPLIIFGIFGFVVFAVLAIVAGGTTNSPQERILRALARIEPTISNEVPPLKDRILRPMLHTLGAQFSRLTSPKERERTQKDLGAVGMSSQWDEGEWKGLQYGLAVLLGLLLFGLFSLLHASPLMRIEALVVGILIGYLFPRSWLKARTKQRQQEIEKKLPDVLDLLTVSVEAGLGFDAALLKVVEKQKGALAEEFLKVLQEIKMGRPRRDALRDLSKRNSVEDLSNVVASLVQADQLGISIGGVLRNQSIQIRQKHRQRAEEKAQKAPVKMMIPLVFFVFPSVFIVILGPAVIQIILNFTN